ncbi:MAG: hypothetical protein AB1492_05050 [Bacillota bacterium]
MEERRLFSVRQIYLYAVSFATLMMLIFGTVNVINNVVDLIYQDPSLNPRFVAPKQLGPDPAPVDPEAQAAEALRFQRQQLYWVLRRLVQSLALVLVALPVYVYHWRKLQQGA